MLSLRNTAPTAIYSYFWLNQTTVTCKILLFCHIYQLYYKHILPKHERTERNAKFWTKNILIAAIFLLYGKSFSSWQIHSTLFVP